ncbi:tyrosyl-tRNA synthetase [Culex quinquefasciatus]|uniref:Tyrosyl-tRNA synthetase n=1 Tax=Culex quinquefasciatus TaxID=7176 RepID=B0X9Y8_CULQU|nr:tyrosyl-tRNA synthetase [Culex quinquefasciatus]|eukprot:XP_001866460.1 tyrosyl-tRNA synthetase [Culex quinquefasciatus]
MIVRSVLLRSRLLRWPLPVAARHYTEGNILKLQDRGFFQDVFPAEAILMARHQRTPELWEAQKRLAQELTLLVHGEEGLRKAEDISDALFSGNVQALGELEVRDIKQTFGGAPLVEILPEPGLSVLDVAMKAKCFRNEREDPILKDATRIIAAGGFSINLNKAKNVAEVLAPGVHILKNGISLLRVGKRNYYIVKWLA